MARAADRRRAALLLLGASLLIAASAWLLLRDDERSEDALLDGVGITRTASDAVLLRSDEPQAVEPGEPGGPALEGRGEDPADRPKRGPVRVRVLGTGDRPLAGLLVHVVPTEAAETHPTKAIASAATDARGEVVFADLPYDGSQSARLLWARIAEVRHGTGIRVVYGHLFNHGRHKGPFKWRPVLGPELLLRTETGLPLDVDVLAADTGRRLPGVGWEARPSFERPPGLADAGVPLAVRLGEDVTVKFALKDLPDDYFVLDPLRWPVRVHPSARRLVARMPLRPEARVLVTFDVPPDAPLGLRWSATFTLSGGKAKKTSTLSDAFGRWHVQRIPHVPGARLKIGGRYGDWAVRAAGVLPADPSETLHLHAKLTRVHRAKLTISSSHKVGFRIQGFAREAGASALRVLIQTDGRVELGQPLTLEFVAGKLITSYVSKSKKQPPFDVTVLHPDGTPAVGASVKIKGRDRMTGRTGVARFRGIPPGTYDALVWGAGAPFRQALTIPQEGAGSATLRGEYGGEVLLRVVDPEGNPLAFASFSVEQPSKLPWCDAWDGVQRIDPFTDAEGSRRLHNLEPGPVKITATLGGRTGTMTVDVVRGVARSAEIVLR